MIYLALISQNALLAGSAIHRDDWLSASTAIGATRCPSDLFSALYFRPASARAETERLLIRILQGPPSTKKQFQALIGEIMSLPDPPIGSAAEANLSWMERRVAEWHRADRQVTFSKLRQAISLRLVVAGNGLNPGADPLQLASALSFFQFDLGALSDSTTKAMWKHRLVHSVVEQGIKVNPEPFFIWLSCRPSCYFGEEPDLFANPRRGFSNQDANNNCLARNAFAEMIRAWVLNPRALTHHAAVERLLRDAASFAKDRMEGKLTDSFPRPFIEAMTGYINDELYPPAQREPAVERRIRELLPQLGLADFSFEPKEF